MIDNEMLQAMSEIMYKKLEPINKRFDVMEGKFESLEDSVNSVKNDVSIIKLDIENTIKPNINLIIDSYVPAAKNFNDASNNICGLKTDIELLKKTVTNHVSASKEGVV